MQLRYELYGTWDSVGAGNNQEELEKWLPMLTFARKFANVSVYGCQLLSCFITVKGRLAVSQAERKSQAYGVLHVWFGTSLAATFSLASVVMDPLRTGLVH